MKFSELKPGEYFKFVYINGAMSFVFRKLLGDRCYSVIDFSCGCWGPDTKVVKCDEEGKEIVEAVPFNQIKEGQFFTHNSKDGGMVFQKPYKPYRCDDMIIVKCPGENVPSTDACIDMDMKCWIIVASPDT